MAKDAKRTIKGYKAFSKAVKFTGKYGLKGLARIPELGIRGSTKLVDALANSEQFQVITTAGGLITVSIAFPVVGIGIGTFVLGKLLADRILERKNPKGNYKNIFNEVQETILLGNRITKRVCEKVISPAMRFVGSKAKDIGENVQTKINDAELFKEV